MSSNDNSNSGGNSSSLYRGLRERVTQLDFPAFQTLVILWLRAKGFSHMSSLGRLHRRGRRSCGGADYLTQVPGSSNLPIAIQIRHWKTPLQRRVVDELFGFLLRHEVPLGMIITSAKVSLRAKTAPAEFPGRRIELVSLSRLVGSMAGLGLGVVKDPDLRVDEPFFQMLGQVGLASRLSAPLPGSSSNRSRPLCKLGLANELAMNPKDPGWQRLSHVGAALLLLALLLWLLNRGGLL